MDLKYQIDICNNVNYLTWLNYLSESNLDDFKNHNDLNYMTEHTGDAQITNGISFYKHIREMNMINTSQIEILLLKNDKLGNPIKYKLDDNICECSPNSMKYIFFGLLNIKHILENKLENFDIIEIGGGYGGQCIILLELLKIFFNYNLIYYSYVIIFIF